MGNDKGPLNAGFMGGLGIGLAIAAFLFLIAPAFTKENYCTGDEAALSCFREWSMMFGTWATVIGGLIAAYLVYRTITQMGIANRHQRDGLMFQAESKLALARHTALSCNNIVKTVQAYFGDTPAIHDIPEVAIESFLTLLEVITDTDLLKQFALEFGTKEPKAVEYLVQSLHHARRVITQYQEGDEVMFSGNEEEIALQRRLSAMSAIQRVGERAAEVERDATAFIARWNSRFSDD